MPKMLILTDSETATGFRLAGVEVREASEENALKELEGVIESQQYGLVAVDEHLVPDPVRATARAMRGRELPVILPMPSLGCGLRRRRRRDRVHERLGPQRHWVRHQNRLG